MGPYCPEPEKICVYRCTTPIPTALFTYCVKKECRGGLGTKDCKVTRKGLFFSFDHDYNFMGEIDCKLFEYREDLERRNHGLPPRDMST